MKILLIFVLSLVCASVFGQSTLPLRADTVVIEKVGGSAELKLKNKTRDTLGVLTNVGGGRTEFRKTKKYNDTCLIIGKDTICGIGGGGGPGADSLKYTYVTRFGAVGDSLTDCTAAVQAAADAASAAGGGVIYYPPGKWRQTATIIIDTSKVIIRGAGAATEIWADGNYGDVFYFRPNVLPAPHANYFHDVGVFDISIHSTVNRTSGYAIHTNFTHSATVANCVIGYMRTAQRNVITPFYMGVGFENESNAIMMNTQVYAWKKGVVFTGTAVGASFRNTNNFDGLITANCFILGDTTKWHESDSTYGVHVGGGVGGVQIEQCNISFYTNGIRVDKQLNNVPNAQFFIGHAFAADNCGAAGIHVGNNGIGEQFQVTGGWAAASGNAADAVIKDAIYVDPTGNSFLQTVIAGGTYRHNLVGNGVNIGGGYVTITGAQFHDNDVADIVLGANVQSATISGNTLAAGVVNNSSIIPSYVGTGLISEPNTIRGNSNSDLYGFRFGNMSSGTSSGATIGVFNNNGPSSSFLNMSITGSNHAGYGALAANTAYFYTPGASKMVFMIDNPTGPLVFAPGGSAEKMRMTPNGRLGIGTTTPSGSIHALGSDVTSGINATLQNTSNNNTVTTTYNARNDAGNTVNFGVSSSIYNANAFIGFNSGFVYSDAPGGLAVTLTNATANFRIAVNGVEKFRIRDTGALVGRFSYSTNLGSTFTRHSLVDKNYVDSISSVAGAGIYNGSRTATGDYVQNWNHFNLKIDSVKRLDINAKETDAFSSTRKSKLSFNWFPSYITTPLKLSHILTGVTGTDSLEMGYKVESMSPQLYSINGSRQSVVHVSSHIGALSAGMNVTDGTKSSGLAATTNTITFSAYDSTMIKLPTTATADSVIGVSNYNPATGTRQMKIIPNASGGSGGIYNGSRTWADDYTQNVNNKNLLFDSTKFFRVLSYGIPDLFTSGKPSAVRLQVNATNTSYPFYMSRDIPNASGSDSVFNRFIVNASDKSAQVWSGNPTYQAKLIVNETALGLVADNNPSDNSNYSRINVTESSIDLNADDSVMISGITRAATSDSMLSLIPITHSSPVQNPSKYKVSYVSLNESIKKTNRVVTITNSYSPALDDDIVLINAASNDIIVTLPLAAVAFANSKGYHFLFKRIDSSGFNVTVQVSGADTMEGGTSFALVGQYEWQNVQCVSTTAWILH
jgi:hypothetical protein